MTAAVSTPVPTNISTTISTLPQYSELPQRIVPALASYRADASLVEERLARLGVPAVRDPDVEGATELLDDVTFTHRFVDVDGTDGEAVRFHYVEAGPTTGETVVFLHGLPDSWYQWHHQMAAFAGDYRCIAFDLKGYGQSSTAEGDYRHEAAAEQLVAALDRVGVDRFNLIAHDRGSVQGDFIAANHPDRVLRYGRGEQHLYHFHPALAPQAAMFRDAPFTGLMADRTRFVVLVYTWIGRIDLPDHEMLRVIQEFSYPDIEKAVPRYFNTTTFHMEWIARRTRLLERWTCPVMVLQSYEGTVQPREYYADARNHIPHAADVLVRFVDAGHFWSLEDPTTTTAHLRELLALPVAGESGS